MAASISSPLSPATVRVRLDHPPRWLEIELALDDEWHGGQFIFNRGSGAIHLQAADDRSRTYDLRTWESGIASGAFYAYRALERPRRRLIVTHLQGSLSSEDMTALATAAALGVAKLLGAELPDADLPEWTVSISQMENGKPET